jgi:hypothetical protein
MTNHMRMERRAGLKSKGITNLQTVATPGQAATDLPQVCIRRNSTIGAVGWMEKLARDARIEGSHCPLSAPFVVAQIPSDLRQTVRDTLA